MKRYVMAMDAGTSSNRCILFDRQGRICALAQSEFPQFYPQPGWVEQDPNDIWSSQIGVAAEALSKVNASPDDVAAIGITNQRETTIVWERATGRPIYNAIVWQCRRTAGACDKLKAEGREAGIREKTGLVLDAYFSASKIRWILDHVEGAQAQAERGELLFGTVDTWLIWKLTRGRVHVTDYSNASRTLLFNIRELRWDPDLLACFHIPAAMLPEVRPSSFVYGESDAQFFGKPIPIAGAAGDQQAALFGQTCFNAGEAKNTYGTGCFLLMNTGEKLVRSQNGLLSTIAWGLASSPVHYALEGSIFTAGSALQWLRDELRLIDTTPDSEYLANKVPDSNGCYVVPAFAGLGAPYWDPYARGCIVGLTRGVNKAHLTRATLESLAYQTCDVLRAMEEDAGLRLSSLKVDGGASRNNFLMQFQSDIIARPVLRPENTEATALGAAYLAGLASGFWRSQDELQAAWKVERRFTPQLAETERNARIRGWKKAVTRALDWAPR